MRFKMKFAIVKEHRDFFQKNGWIEFENFLSPDELTQANEALDQALAERLHTSVEKLRQFSSDQQYLQSRDLWRLNAFLRKLATQPRFAEIASELIEKKPLRLGYDQLLPARYPTNKLLEPTHSIYTHFLEQTAELATISCVQEVLGGVMIALGGKKEDSAGHEIEGVSVYPLQPGNVIYFQPHLPINWQNLYAYPGQRFYFIVYTSVVAHYHLQPQDPHTHTLKHLGYVFNDKLNDRLHPIVYR